MSITVVAANALPTVSLTAPANGAKFSVGSNITLSANATDTDGSIAQVEFYAGATWLGVRSVPPYTVTWNAVPAGNHTLTAKATDNQGGIKISSSVAISVVAPVETNTYYHLDLQGSPAAATNASGAVVWKEAYRPYGERILKQDGGTNNQWFTGKIHDEATGLSYFGARWYDPAIGRFMGVDPQDFGEDNLHSFNRYAYGNNNPYKFVDPDGNSPVDIVFFLVDAVKLAGAISSGVGVGPAAVDFAISAASLASPVPGVGQLAKAAKAADKAVDVGKAASSSGRSLSKAEDATHAGSKLPNRKTDVGKSEFERNLEDAGFSKSTSKDGKINIYEKDSTKYTTRDFSKSTNGPTAEAFKNGKPTVKYRLGE